MKTRQLALLLAAVLPAGLFAHEPGEGGCSSDTTLPPLVLETQHKTLLKERSETPRSAADYYFALPASYFSIVENTTERRATFIDFTTLSDRYLHAKHFFECDAGGFEVTLRVFDTEGGPVVGITSWQDSRVTIHKNEGAARGELQSIDASVPRFWRYKDGQWIAAKDLHLPILDKEFIVNRYRNRYHGHLNDADQQKYIWLSYDLPPEGNTIRVTGRENFMDPSETYEWAAFDFDGTKFVRNDRDAVDPPVARAVEKPSETDSDFDLSKKPRFATPRRQR